MWRAAAGVIALDAVERLAELVECAAREGAR
jgi:hypothetical protein